MLSIFVPVASRAAGLCERWAKRRADCACDPACRPCDCRRDCGRESQDRRPHRLSRRRVGSAARRCAARRRTVRGHDGHRRRRHLRRRRLCARGLPNAFGLAEARAPFTFWILLLSIWSALNLVFVAGDLFTLYVGLELLTFAAVPLVCLDGRAETFQAALALSAFRAARVGSLSCRDGADLRRLRNARHRPAFPADSPRASDDHSGGADDGGAPREDGALSPASVASACPRLCASSGQRRVVGARREGTLLHCGAALVRCDAELPAPAARQLLAALGAAAIVFGSILALRQTRLKLLIAYSTLAQIGYLFLMFPLASGSGSASQTASPYPAACFRRFRTPRRRLRCSCRRGSSTRRWGTTGSRAFRARREPCPSPSLPSRWAAWR